MKKPNTHKKHTDCIQYFPLFHVFLLIPPCDCNSHEMIRYTVCRAHAFQRVFGNTVSPPYYNQGKNIWDFRESP